MQVIQTGIRGLDALLGGGILAGGTVLVEGAPGCGKTTFGLQYIHEGISRFDENGLVVTFEQFPEQMHRDALNFGWDLRELEKQDRLRIMCTSPEVLAKLLQQPDSLLDKVSSQLKVKRVFVDSVTHLEHLTDDRKEQRAIVNGLLNSLKNRGFTTFLAKEIESRDEEGDSFEAYIVDAVIRINNQLDEYNLRRRRTVEILKTRGQEHVSGQHPFRFADSGVQVFPLNFLTDLPEESWQELSRIATGVEGLDQLLGGGIPSRSAVLLSGGAGTGKTICGLQFLMAGIRDSKERGILFSYEQTAAEIEAIAGGFGWDLKKHQDSGDLLLAHNYFTEVSLDEHLWDIQEAIQRTGARRIVLDSLTALLHPVSEHRYLVTEKVSQLVRLMKSLNCTAYFISSIPSGMDRVSTFGVEESLVDSVLLLETARDDTRRKRSVEVCKARGINHVMGERRMTIGPHGIEVYFRRAKSTGPGLKLEGGDSDQ
ncbi:MAG: hypothetical protein AUJ92_08755 [Armatimonadetes bacterium CG2_30_59_28]|nr:MAG: hypothetical protein AUJ92_08755 [Armatimonadetes bacterium CG2_30_59_28]